jgi:hypothetical protein
MRDWRHIVRDKIERLSLPVPQKEDIAAELASHLEEEYEERLGLGLPESQAFESALSDVADWAELTRRIHNAKREELVMNDRTKQLWLPGLASFWAAVICDAALQWLGFGQGKTALRLGVYRLPGVNYGVWLIAAFACGALGAYLSRRAGGPRFARLLSGLFTCSVMLIAMAVVTGICAATRAVGLGFTTLDFGMLLKPVLTVVVIPGAAMLTGILPFLSDSERIALP